MNTSSSFAGYPLPLFLILVPVISLSIPFFLVPPAEVTPLLLVIVPALTAVLSAAISGGRKAVLRLLKKPFQLHARFIWVVVALLIALAVRLVMSLVTVWN